MEAITVLCEGYLGSTPISTSSVASSPSNCCGDNPCKAGQWRRCRLGVQLSTYGDAIEELLPSAPMFVQQELARIVVLPL